MSPRNICRGASNESQQHKFSWKRNIYLKGGLRGGSRGSIEPPFIQNFIFTGNLGYWIYSKYSHPFLFTLYFSSASQFNYLWMCVNCWMSGKQCRPWSDAALCGVWSGSTLFAQTSFWILRVSTLVWSTRAPSEIILDPPLILISHLIVSCVISLRFWIAKGPRFVQADVGQLNQTAQIHRLVCLPKYFFFSQSPMHWLTKAHIGLAIKKAGLFCYIYGKRLFGRPDTCAVAFWAFAVLIRPLFVFHGQNKQP